ncbi:MAG TPA: hypothetical protein DCL06_06230 [Corynebacterium variabile]|uniref:Uncharacterized protein n=1 Tax=Corynebacterium variabile TaxID=1727 RepID=A0A3B9QUW1_9CORY|nr:hypothetical protein [Corynebacterium variabile]
MIRPDRLHPQGGAAWYPTGPVTEVRRQPNRRTTITGADDHGNPIRITLTAEQAQNLGARITAAGYYHRATPAAPNPLEPRRKGGK